MRKELVQDYLMRARIRIRALEFFRSEGDHADVVREAQEVVELLLKALMMRMGLDVPKVHDVSRAMEVHRDLFPPLIREEMPFIRRLSRDLRKERELAFYGAHDWIPGQEYTDEDSARLLGEVRRLASLVEEAVRLLDEAG
ncbi:HEPN domain protein [Spirochaeta thermophila DSM 6578]|uniref:HEPN domain protein n=1 Tax=Winmispira thermophila (strain ATCC 700085 / DSM 6578 / Z-1203) TaxID=869211 RepID=G0GAW6_WINT7|nr:HEPN domain-containing protein [Spirochaeta thermophila]AEJ61862.1 HEPN domain protein [Spirochaeta thermophila DSM 6578]